MQTDHRFWWNSQPGGALVQADARPCTENKERYPMLFDLLAPIAAVLAGSAIVVLIEVGGDLLRNSPKSIDE